MQIYLYNTFAKQETCVFYLFANKSFYKSSVVVELQ